jgi:uncharacterized MAPEG superfamily protein
MTIELHVLGWSIMLGLLYVFVAAGLATQQRGVKWNASNRDAETKPLTGAAATLAVVLAKQNTAHTALGAQIYFWGRLVYLPVYLIGIPYLRTVVWIISLWGLLQVMAGL